MVSVTYANKDLELLLLQIYHKSEAVIIAAWVFEKILGYSSAQIRMNGKQELSQGQIDTLAGYTQELMAHRPVQYVLGESYFCGLKLITEESVLIPRPETEELVAWCLSELKDRAKQDHLRILDIGTGSGCIALALKSKWPKAEVYAIDHSVSALKIAERNAIKTGLDLILQRVDILNEIERSTLPVFDIIISNPPYITIKEKATMAPHVLNYEPHDALFVQNNDPLQFYKSITRFSEKHLCEGGQLFFELHAEFAQETQNWMLRSNWNAVLKNDLQGRQRMLMASFKVPDRDA